MKASKEDPPLGSALLPPSDRSSFKGTLDTFASLGGMAPSFVPSFFVSEDPRLVLPIVVGGKP